MLNGAVKEEKTAYDYKEIIVKKDNASFLLDSYEKLGWQLDKHHGVQSPIMQVGFAAEQDTRNKVTSIKGHQDTVSDSC